jgi:WD40 repeat protein
MKRERLIERFESPVYAAAISQSGDILALAGYSQRGLILTCSADGTIKLQSLHEATGKKRHLTGHTGAVKSLAFDPRREFLASAGSDGTIRIWNYSDKDQEVASIDSLPRSDPR